MNQTQATDQRDGVEPVESRALVPVGFDDGKRRVLRSMYPDMTDTEEEIFVLTCNRTFLDPFARQIYPVWRKTDNKMVMSIQVAIDGFRLQAARSAKYEGQVGPYWCGPDGVWKDVWLEKTPPSAARVGIWRAGAREPIWGTAHWAEYVQTTSTGAVTRMWRNMPANQIAKCAESLALRKACPAELSGLYSEDEMGQAETIEHDPSEAPVSRPPVAGPPPTQTPPSSAAPPAGPSPHRPPAAQANGSAPAKAPVSNGDKASSGAPEVPPTLVPLGEGTEVTTLDDPDLVRFMEIRKEAEGVGMVISEPKLPFRRVQFVNMANALLLTVNKSRQGKDLPPYFPPDPTAPPPVIDAAPGEVKVSDAAEAPAEVPHEDGAEGLPPTVEQLERIERLAADKNISQVIIQNGEIVDVAERLADPALTRGEAGQLGALLNELPAVPDDEDDEDLGALGERLEAQAEAKGESGEKVPF